jgi:hypothetical protein
VVIFTLSGTRTLHLVSSVTLLLRLLLLLLRALELTPRGAIT